MAPTVAPFGTWDSPISANLLASEGISLVQIVPNAPKPKSDPPSPDKIYYVEGRPAEQGRFCIVECTFPPNASTQLHDVLPQEYSARTSVHSYGGGAFTCQYNNNLVFSDGKTNGVYSLDPRTTQVDCIVTGDEKVFYGDLDARDDILQRWILAICEDHRSETIVNSIVAIDIKTGAVHTVVSGADFYTHPRLSVAANRQAMICWIQWNHPDMPWTGSQLFIAPWVISESSEGEKPRVDAPICISGRPGSESVAQPKWDHEDGSLLFCNDISGYWQLYRLETGCTTPTRVSLRGLEEGNFAGPEWRLGRSVSCLPIFFAVPNINSSLAPFLRSLTMILLLHSGPKMQSSVLSWSTCNPLLINSCRFRPLRIRRRLYDKSQVITLLLLVAHHISQMRFIVWHQSTRMI